MDLLQGYSSSEDENNQKDGTKTVPPVPLATASQKKLPPPQQRKGKKLLSLASVLPQHVLDQLAKSQVGDSSSDEDDDGNKKRKALKKSPPTQIEASKEGKTPGVSRDKGLSNLLTALHSSKPIHTGSLLRSMPKAAPKGVKPERMGAAFLSAETTTADRKVLRDIHGEASHQDEEEDEKPASIPLTTPAISIPSVPAPTRRSVPAPSSIRRMPAAPMARAPSPQTLPVQMATETPVPAAPQDHASRKRARHATERALRQGHMHAVAGDTHLDQARVDVGPNPETYAVPTHGIKAVPTALYDPSAGTAVMGAGGKGRGKNQITHLLASAAQLETARARGLASSSTAGKIHRANAKRKYGW